VLPQAGLDGAAPAIIQVCALATMSLAQRELGNRDRAHEYGDAAIPVIEAWSMGAMPPASLAFTLAGESRADAGDIQHTMSSFEHGLWLRRKATA